MEEMTTEKLQLMKALIIETEGIDFIIREISERDNRSLCRFHPEEFMPECELMINDLCDVFRSGIIKLLEDKRTKIIIELTLL